MSPNVLDLRDPQACDPSISGAKAANLARAAVAGMDVLPGFVLTTSAASIGVADSNVAADLRRAWQELTGGTDRPLVVRSSSTIEDAGNSSMAGQFTSVLDVCGWFAFERALQRVLASAERVSDRAHTARPMAVLVQRQLDAPTGGVLFSVDPVTGDSQHLMVEVVPARPDSLVSGSVTAAHYVISRHGRVIEQSHTDVAQPLSRHDRRALVGLARRAERAFVGPQDIEWAFDDEGKLWLLQTRPVTATAEPAGKGCLMGPGPVAETFPSPLRRLEAELFVEPLRSGIVRALTATATVSRRRLGSSRVVTTVGGWVAADLELFGIRSSRSRLRRRLDPSLVVRRLVAAWRVGRLRVSLPQLAHSVIDTVDADLAGIGDLTSRSNSELAELLDRALVELSTVHTFEVLAGMLLADEPNTQSATLIALHELVRGRESQLTDAEILLRSPVVLALIPPSLGPACDLPIVATTPTAAGGLDRLGIRDALRLRSRWVQELIAQIVRTLGTRLAAAHGWQRSELIREMSWHEVVTVIQGGALPPDLISRADVLPGPQLPTTFRLTASGAVAHSRTNRKSTVDGIAAGGGRGVGEARHRVVLDGQKPGVVLISRHLEPQLAPLLPSLDGLVSETGSALSHLAILAREMNVPTVVGVEDALGRFPPGTRLLVDGDVGEIEVLAAAAESIDARKVGQ